MKKVKALLYCTKGKPYLYKTPEVMNFEGEFFTYSSNKNLENCTLNGTIVAECEIEVEEIFCISLSNGVGFDFYYYTDTITDVREKSCLDEWQLQSYLGAGIVGEKVGYALHISNLKVFDEPLTFKNDYIYKDRFGNETLKQAPQNMCNVYDRFGNHYVLISIQPQWLCKILNGEKDIEIRKQVLNYMKE